MFCYVLLCFADWGGQNGAFFTRFASTRQPGAGGSRVGEGDKKQIKHIEKTPKL